MIASKLLLERKTFISNTSCSYLMLAERKDGGSDGGQHQYTSVMSLCSFYFIICHVLILILKKKIVISFQTLPVVILCWLKEKVEMVIVATSFC